MSQTSVPRQPELLCQILRNAYLSWSSLWKGSSTRALPTDSNAESSPSDIQHGRCAPAGYVHDSTGKKASPRSPRCRQSCARGEPRLGHVRRIAFRRSGTRVPSRTCHTPSSWMDPAEVKSTKELSDEVVTQTSKALIAADVQGTALNPATEAAIWLASLVPPIRNTSIYASRLYRPNLRGLTIDRLSRTLWLGSSLKNPDLLSLRRCPSGHHRAPGAR